jgi:carboxypeptidase Q
VLLRSVTPVSISSVHTGNQHYDDAYPKIPIAAITVEDSDMLLRMSEKKQSIRVNLFLDSDTQLGSNSSNLVFEIPGTERPKEILLMGGHIDSWDTGSQTGANDDGGGFFTVFEALRLIKQNGLRAKRTLRFIAWSGEEWGGYYNNGARQYFQQHINV